MDEKLEIKSIVLISQKASFKGELPSKILHVVFVLHRASQWTRRGFRQSAHWQTSWSLKVAPTPNRSRRNEPTWTKSQWHFILFSSVLFVHCSEWFWKKIKRKGFKFRHVSGWVVLGICLNNVHLLLDGYFVKNKVCTHVVIHSPPSFSLSHSFTLSLSLTLSLTQSHSYVQFTYSGGRTCREIWTTTRVVWLPLWRFMPSTVMWMTSMRESQRRPTCCLLTTLGKT